MTHETKAARAVLAERAHKRREKMIKRIAKRNGGHVYPSGWVVFSSLDDNYEFVRQCREAKIRALGWT